MSAGPEEIALAIARLRGGGLVAFPTETVYGLGARALDEAAVAKVFAAKGRPDFNPLIVHVSSEEMAKRVASEWPDHAAALARAFWPGPLSIVVPRGSNVPANVVAGGPTVAVRAPAHPLTLALIDALDEPLVGPSANLSGRVSPTTAAHVRESFSEEEVFVLDGGPCSRGIESTVVDVSDGRVRVLRKGLITEAEILAALAGEIASDVPGRSTPGSEADTEPLRSPGMLSVHYAPTTRCMLVASESLRAHAQGKVVAIVHSDVQLECVTLRLGSSPESYAAAMYAALRDADAMKPDLIAIEHPPRGRSARETELWEAILDRLSRACADRGNQGVENPRPKM